MENKIYLTLLLVVSFVFSTCKKDDSSSISVNNIVEYDNNKYKLENGIYINYGSFNYFGNNATHYNFDFYTTDGYFISDSNGKLTDVKGNIAIYAILESYGSNSFKEGTFIYIDNANNSNLNDAQLKTKYENKSFFTEASVIIGKNMNSSLSSGKEVSVKSGIITIEGSIPNFNIIYDLVLENNKTIKGSFKNTFKEYKE